MRNGHLINNLYFLLWRSRISWLQTISKPVAHKYLFILSGAACGSTLLHEMISESNNVAIATKRWAREGMRLPLVREWLHYNGQYNWKHQPAFNWKVIHHALLQYWDPRKAIFLDKAPIYLFQARHMAKEFAPAYFICLHRNPYSQIESYLRKSTMDVEDCITYTLDTLIQQKQYLEQFDSCFGLSYTELTENPEDSIKKLCKWLPELGSIQLKQEYGAHNILNKKIAIKNLDHQKIDRLTDQQIEEINSRLLQHQDLMQYLGYAFIYR